MLGLLSPTARSVVSLAARFGLCASAVCGATVLFWLVDLACQTVLFPWTSAVCVMTWAPVDAAITPARAASRERLHLVLVATVALAGLASAGHFGACIGLLSSALPGTGAIEVADLVGDPVCIGTLIAVTAFGICVGRAIIDSHTELRAGFRRVTVKLPAPMTSDPIVICDDGQGMTSTEVESEYLDIARDKRSIKGEETPRRKRRVKGKKGIGKFAGLAAARKLQLRSVREGQCAVVEIDKDLILAAQRDIERIPLPLVEDLVPGEPNGTRITLTELDPDLNFPNPDALRTLLYYEYGRATGFTGQSFTVPPRHQ